MFNMGDDRCVIWGDDIDVLYGEGRGPVLDVVRSWMRHG